MPLYHASQARRKRFVSTVAKHYISAKRADKPDIVFSVLALASETISAAMSGNHARHQFVGISHPYLYHEYIVYNYINKDRGGTPQIECSFSKSDLTDDEWNINSKAAHNRRTCVNGVVESRGALH